mmetsp:Transcript_54850/g.63310  ORF Transcript_54850/g.63310 Transcript_54850/m.63310 type:complete len:287 (+) Transcript_54850:71-931(+)
MRIMFSIIFYYIYFLSSASLKTHVLARRHTTNKNRLSFGPRKITSTIFVSLNSSSSSSVSSLPTSSDFFPEKDPRILETSVITISLIRGGQQGNGDYYDSKGYQNDSPSSSSSSSLVPFPRSNSGVTGTGRTTASVQVVPLLLLFGVDGAATAVAVATVEEVVTLARLLRFAVDLVVPGPVLLLLLVVLLLPRFLGSVALPMDLSSRSCACAWNNRTPPFRCIFSLSLLPILLLRRRHELLVPQVGVNWLSGDMRIAVVVVLLLLVGVVGNKAIVQVVKVDLFLLW